MAFGLRMVGIHVKRGIKESGRKQQSTFHWNTAKKVNKG
jgi:hypothetical protein